MGFEFNFPSFGIGAGAGVLTTLATQRLLKLWRERQGFATSEPSTAERTIGARRGSRRYLAELLQFCQTSHLLGRHVPLSSLLVEPRFVPYPPLVKPPSTDELRDVFDVLPLLPDFPQAHAFFNPRTITLEELGKGHKHIALIGASGTGKTTALLAMALWSMGQLRFSKPEDVIAKRIAEEEKELTPEERAERVRKRVLTAQQAREQYRAFMGKTDGEAQKPTEAQSLKQFSPLYVHLANLSLDASEYGSTIDPAEPFVRALQAHVTPLTAKLIPRAIYRLLAEGRALVLLDGMDDLPEDERGAKLVWLAAFTAQYNKNFIVIASLPYRDQHYRDMGYAPMLLRGWTDEDTDHYVQAMLTHWKQIAGNHLTPSDAQLEHISKKMRLLTPMTLTLHVWSTFLGRKDDEAQQWRAYLNAILSDADALMPVLQQMACLQLDEGYITAQALISALLSADDTPTDEKEQKNRERQAQTQVRRWLAPLLKGGVLRALRHNRYRFALLPLAEHIAATTLAERDDNELRTLARRPAWANALAYGNAHASLDILVKEALLTNVTVSHDALVRLLFWLRYGGVNVAWRVNLLKLVGGMITAPHQYSIVRERLAFALLASGDESVQTAFRRMLKSENSDLRRIACLSLGCLRDTEAMRPISSLATSDPEQSVRLSAVFGLGALGSDDALFALADILDVSQENDVRQAVTETLAMFPEVGYPILYDAIASETLMVRRAAVWGLGRVRTDWSLILLNEIYLEDDEWFVRSAAAQVFEDVYEDGKQGAKPYPALDDVDWLRQWASEQTEAGRLPSNVRGLARLKYAIEQRENALIRLLGVALCGQLGLLDATAWLYEALDDSEEAIRDAAYRSLDDLQARHGIQLLAPLPA